MEDTEALGERVGKLLIPGTVIAMRGGLGAGKTVFARGIARGLGVEDSITSPTYTLINEYQGRLPFYHMDAYRLAGEEEFDFLDARRYLYGDGVCLIEWSERVEKVLPENAVTIIIEVRGDASRTISLQAPWLEKAIS